MGFELCHPAVNLIYFVSVIYGVICFRHPIFLLISFLSAVSYSIKRNGMKAVVFDAVLLPLTAVFALYYSTYNHFGITVIKQNLIGNNLTFSHRTRLFIFSERQVRNSRFSSRFC